MVVGLLCACAAVLGAGDGISLPERGVCAHRGASSVFPENTLPAFEAAGRLGAHMIEFDVYLSKDGHPVIMHDPTVDRTTDGTGKVRDLTLAEIKKLDAGSWKSPQYAGLRVPALEEALAVMPSNVWLNIHMKENGEAGAVVARAIQQAGRVHQAVLACNQLAATAAHEIIPDLKICNMERQGNASDYVETTVRLRAQFIQLVGKQLPDTLKASVDRLKSCGVRINYYGIEDAPGLRQLYTQGVDFPLVNDVAPALAVAGEFGITPNIPRYTKD